MDELGGTGDRPSALCGSQRAFRPKGELAGAPCVLFLVWRRGLQGHSLLTETGAVWPAFGSAVLRKVLHLEPLIIRCVFLALSEAWDPGRKRT